MIACLLSCLLDTSQINNFYIFEKYLPFFMFYTFMLIIDQFRLFGKYVKKEMYKQINTYLCKETDNLLIDQLSTKLSPFTEVLLWFGIQEELKFKFDK